MCRLLCWLLKLLAMATMWNKEEILKVIEVEEGEHTGSAQ